MRSGILDPWDASPFATPPTASTATARSRREETLAVEEPLEIRVGGSALAVTMRTPGDDFDLVAGYLVSESVVRAGDDIASMRYCGDPASTLDADGRPTYNVVDATLGAGVPSPDASVYRRVATTSACGLCGRTSIDAVRATSTWPVADDPLTVTPELLAGLPDTLRAQQKLFARTGGLHAAGLFTADGTLVCLREDVGRHNAVDKIVGWALRQGRLPLRGHLLLVSGRASFELTQKASLAGIPLLAAVSAPSSLAVELAAGVRSHPDRLPARGDHERLHRRAPGARRPGGYCFSGILTPSTLGSFCKHRNRSFS